jgi:hypothetical protein
VFEHGAMRESDTRAFIHSIAGLPLSTRAKEIQLVLRFSELSTAFNAAFQSNLSKEDG